MNSTPYFPKKRKKENDESNKEKKSNNRYWLLHKVNIKCLLRISFQKKVSGLWAQLASGCNFVDWEDWCKIQGWLYHFLHQRGLLFINVMCLQPTGPNWNRLDLILRKETWHLAFGSWLSYLNYLSSQSLQSSSLTNLYFYFTD
jgi:hypothetical protein